MASAAVAGTDGVLAALAAVGESTVAEKTLTQTAGAIGDLDDRGAAEGRVAHLDAAGFRNLVEVTNGVGDEQNSPTLVEKRLQGGRPELAIRGPQIRSESSHRRDPGYEPDIELAAEFILQGIKINVSTRRLHRP